MGWLAQPAYTVQKWIAVQFIKLYRGHTSAILARGCVFSHPAGTACLSRT